MLKIFLLLFIALNITNCQLLKSAQRFQGEEIGTEDEEDVDIHDDWEPRKAQPVAYMHWKCCIDLCNDPKPKSVTKELDSPYIVCHCRNGKVFRVTRLKAAIRNGKKVYQ